MKKNLLINIFLCSWFIFLCSFVNIDVAAEEIGNPSDIFKKQGRTPAQDAQASESIKGFFEEIGQNFQNTAESLTNDNKDQQKKTSQSEKARDRLMKQVVYEGYSQEYVGITKKLLKKGKIKAVDSNYSKDENNTQGYLDFLEQGSLALLQGDYTKAEDNFALAEYNLIDRMEVPKVSEYLTKMTGSLAGIISGKEDIGLYWGTDYERILMLNYKSIAYLLEGDRKAYNVTRRAINWQNMAKRAFKEKVREATIKLDGEEEKQKKKGNDVSELGISETLEQVFSPMKDKAQSVSSAYVNPFGFYVAGMVQEFESYQDASLRHNALISYKKALELNPKSRVIQQAIADLEKGSCPTSRRLLHVVAGNGFAPEKKVVIFEIGSRDMAVPLKLPLYEPCPSQVSKIVVYTVGGKRLGELSTVADVEAVCLRHQEDMMPLNMLKVTAVAARAIFEKTILQNAGFIGSLISSVHDEMSVCDTRSWMSLPATIEAARMYIPKNLRTVKVVSYDQNGKRLASKRIKLDRSSHNFVYVRSIDQVMYAHPNQEMWLVN